MEVSALSERVATLALEPGDEVIDSIRRGCESSRFSEAFIVGSGEIEDAELLVLGPVFAGKTAGRTQKKLAGPWDLVSLTGQLARGELELRAVLARESGTGPLVIGGILVGGIAVTARVSLESISAPIARAVPSEPERLPAQPEVAPSPVPSPVTFAFPPTASSTPTPQQQPGVRMPPKLGRPVEGPDVYPEENDVVTHFHFGKCTVLASDGERLRLQQERDGRVREVALSMLRIGPVTVLEDGHRHWDLSRKH